MASFSDSITHIADALTAKDVSLLSLALKAADDDVANQLLSQCAEILEVDQLTPKIVDGMTPEQVDALQRFETSHRTALTKLVTDKYVNDAMIAQGTEQKDKSASFLRYVGASMLAFSCLFLCAIIWLPIPEQQLRYVDYVLGFISGTIVTTIMNFFFGSTASKSDHSAETPAESPAEKQE